MKLPCWAVFALCLASGRGFARETAAAVAKVTAGFVSSISVTSGGSGYTSEPAVTITGGGGSGATAKAILSGDKVAVVVVLTAGSGYTSIPAVMIAAPAVEPWVTLRMAPAVRVEGRTGQGLAIERQLASVTTWGLWTNVTAGTNGMEVVDLSQGSSQAKYRSISQNMPATATAKLTAGFVTGITVTASGEGYSQPPRVTLSGGGGSGATAQAILDGDKVGTVIVLTAGNGYSSAPSVKIDAPPSDRQLTSRMVPVLTLRAPLARGSRIEVGGTIQGPWTTVTKSWSSESGLEMVDLSPDERARFYRLQTNVLPASPVGFVWIPPGTFVMGSPLSEVDRDPDAGENQHSVQITRGYWIQDHETTRGEYAMVMGGNVAGSQAELPTEDADWNSAVEYCRQKTLIDRASGLLSAQYAYRLPTEAEWEFAARAGVTDARYGPVDQIAWHDGNSGGMPHPVRQKLANPWGLHDMLGNVWEWCSDWFEDLPSTPQIDPQGPLLGSSKVMRGGAWNDESSEARFANRNGEAPITRAGFRPVLVGLP